LLRLQRPPSAAAEDRNTDPGGDHVPEELQRPPSAAAEDRNYGSPRFVRAAR